MNQLSPEETYSPEAEELKRVVKAAHANYGKYPNVIGIGAGKKSTGGNWTDELSIHFFVSKKVSSEDLKGRKVPTFVYGRFEDGRTNRKKRYVTDVIEAGNIKLTCCAGTTIYGKGKIGTITLLFRNKAISNDKWYYILTCSHVVADLAEQISDGVINSGYCDGTFADVVKRSKCNDEYDIALAKLTENAVKELGPDLPRIDCKIAGITLILTHFFPSDKIDMGLLVHCRVGNANPPGRVVTARGGAVSILYKGCTYKNLYLLNIGLKVGDSGGIVYHDDAAVGIVVMSDGINTWFQPLKDALRYLDNDIRCFSLDE